MTKLLEIKDKVFRFYSKLETYIKPVLKFIGFLIAYLMIASNIGYMSKISSPLVSIVLALVGALLPLNVTLLLMGVVILLDLYSLSAEVAAVALILMLIIYFMYFRFLSKSGGLAILTPVLLRMNIPYAVPVGTGMLGKPYEIIPAVCGTILFYFLDGVRKSAAALTTVSEDSEDASTLTTSLNQLIGNREMYLMIILMVATTIVVYTVRRLKIDHAWKIANVSAFLIQLIGFLIGYLVMGSSDKVVWVIVGNLLSLATGFVLEFLFFNLDYARTERVQFEDDDYYYYVKAVPKKMVAGKNVSVKHFGATSSMGKRIDHTPVDMSEEEEQISNRVMSKEIDLDDDWLK